jgi:hypothetical protein
MWLLTQVRFQTPSPRLRDKPLKPTPSGSHCFLRCVGADASDYHAGSPAKRVMQQRGNERESTSNGLHTIGVPSCPTHCDS